MAASQTMASSFAFWQICWDSALTKKQNADISALGAAYLAGLQVGVFAGLDQLVGLNRGRTEVVRPDAGNAAVKQAYAGWRGVVGR